MARMMHGGQFWAMWVFGALFWASLLVFGVWLVRRLSNRPRDGGQARRILEERYARGEIDEDEFRRRSETLARSD